MHELKELVDDSLQKLPMVAQKARILSNNVPATSSCMSGNIRKLWITQVMCIHNAHGDKDLHVADGPC